MTTRQKTGEVGIYRRGRRYWIRVTMTDPTGRRRDRSAYAPPGAKMRQAVEIRERLTAELAAACQPPAPAPTPPPSAVTLRDYAASWIALKGRRLRRSTADHYIDTIARRLLPVLGDLPVAWIRRADVERWVAWAEDQRTRTGHPYAEDTLRSWWRPVVQILRDAAADHDIADPTLRIRPPRSPRRAVREQRTLTAAEVGQLLAAVAEGWPAWHAEVYTLALSGARPGELYALTWADLDRAEGLIHIRRAVRRGIVGGTKTDAPRSVALTPDLLAVLDGHRQALIRAQHPGLETGLIFPAADGGHRGADALYGVLTLAGRAAGLPLRPGPQVIRRTFNTLAILAGVDRQVLRAQLGHTSEAMTARYSGIPAAAKRAAVAELEAQVLAGGPSTDRR